MKTQYSRLTGILPAASAWGGTRSRLGFLMTAMATGSALAGFIYPEPTDPILSASFSADFAALVAHRSIGGIEVNRVSLLGLGGVTLDLSDDFYGVSDLVLGDTPQIQQGPTETGVISVPIPSSFFPSLQTGHVGIRFLATDTDDGLFAIDFLSLTIETGGGIFESFIDVNDGFDLGLADGGTLSDPLPISIGIGASGTGFDETIGSKSHDNEVPDGGQTLSLLSIGLVALWICANRPRTMG